MAGRQVVVLINVKGTRPIGIDFYIEILIVDDQLKEQGVNF